MSDIVEVIKIAKSMKRPIVHVGTNYILGTDAEFCTLSMIEINLDIPRSFTAILNNLLIGDAKEKFAMSYPQIFFTEYVKLTDDAYINIWEEDVLYKNIFSLFRKVGSFLTYLPKVFSISNLENDLGFMSGVAKLKVNDGLTSYVFDDKYLITSFNKVQAINATDKVSLNIYDIDPMSYLYEFIIDKKKYKVKEYIRYRKMI